MELIEFINKFPTTRKEIDINVIQPNKWNPNLQSDIMFKKEMESIKKFGFIQPILVRQFLDGLEQYEIIDGEHRWRACKELGYTKILVDTIGEISENEAKVLTIIMNRLRGEDDILKRAEIMKEISQGQSSLLELLPYEDREIQEEMRLLDFDFSQFENNQTPEEKDTENLGTACKKAVELQIILQKIYQETNNTKLKLAIEQFKTFVVMLKSYLKCD